MISIVCRYPPPATPVAAPEVATAIFNTGGMMSKWLQKLQRVFANASRMLKDSKRIFTETKSLRKVYDKSAALMSPARGAALMAGARRGIFVDNPLGMAAKGAREGLAEGVKSLPQKVVVETVKGSGKAVAEDIDGESEPNGTGTALYDGPGPHRVTGTLEQQ